MRYENEFIPVSYEIVRTLPCRHGFSTHGLISFVLRARGMRAVRPAGKTAGRLAMDGLLMIAGTDVSAIAEVLYGINNNERKRRITIKMKGRLVWSCIIWALGAGTQPSQPPLFRLPIKLQLAFQPPRTVSGERARCVARWADHLQSPPHIPLSHWL